MSEKSVYHTLSESMQSAFREAARRYPASIGFSYGILTRSLDALVRRGLMSEDQRGEYSLTDEGVKVAKEVGMIDD